MARKDISVEERLENLQNEQKKSHNKRRRKNIAVAVKGAKYKLEEKRRKSRKSDNYKK